MPREQSDNRRRAKEIYDEHNGQISNREIAGILGCSEKSISGWKCKDNWTGDKRSTPNKKERSTPKRKRGGQPGNKNATGPPRNQHARKHGLFSKWLPEEINEIIGQMPENHLDIVWHNIELQYAQIIHAQQILYVTDKHDKTREVSMYGDDVTAYEIQQAWDKQASNMAAQSRAISTLMRLVKEYDDLVHSNWDIATDIQRARLDQIRAQTAKLESDSSAEAGEEVVIVNDLEKDC